MIPHLISIEAILPLFPPPGITRARLLDWVRTYRFPRGFRPGGRKSQMFFHANEVVLFFERKFGEAWPQAVEAVKAAASKTAPTKAEGQTRSGN